MNGSKKDLTISIKDDRYCIIKRRESAAYNLQENSYNTIVSIEYMNTVSELCLNYGVPEWRGLMVVPIASDSTSEQYRFEFDDHSVSDIKTGMHMPEGICELVKEIDALIKDTESSDRCSEQARMEKQGA